MKRRVAVGLAMAVLVFALPAVAMEEIKQIDGWASFRQDTKMLEGAFENTLTYNALRTYIPGVGMVFLMESRGSIKVEQVRKEFEKTLKYIIPSVENLGDNELVVLCFSAATFGEDWEIMYITTRAEAPNPQAWTVYYNEGSTR